MYYIEDRKICPRERRLGPCRRPAPWSAALAPAAALSQGAPPWLLPRRPAPWSAALAPAAALPQGAPPWPLPPPCPRERCLGHCRRPAPGSTALGPAAALTRGFPPWPLPSEGPNITLTCEEDTSLYKLANGDLDDDDDIFRKSD